MSLPDAVFGRVAELLSRYTGTGVSIAHYEPIAEGWSAQVVTAPWPWITRCILDGSNGVVPRSAIVKTRRPEEHLRSAWEWFFNERAALEFLTSIGSAAGPRLLAADDQAGILVIEDLGTGAALDDLLVGGDTARAELGLLAYAKSLGRMHVATLGHAAEFYELRSRLGPVDPAFDRVSILGAGVEQAWSQVERIVAGRPYLPAPNEARSDVDALLQVLAEPGAFLAFTNGDTCPQNCRISDGGVRFVDFEHACFRHALLDATALRFPFQACPCWSHLPKDVSRRAEDAYRQEMARGCPDVLDDAMYAHGLAAACAAWTIVRMVRLPKLEQGDAPHPMGFSRRGQLLDAIDTTVECAHQSSSLHALAAWLTETRDTLRIRWPHIGPVQPVYPAFRARG